MIGLPHTSMRLYIFARRASSAPTSAWLARLPRCQPALLCSRVLFMQMSNILKCRCHVNESKRKYIIKFPFIKFPSLPSLSHSGKCYLANQQTELCPNMTGVSLSLSPSLRLSLSLPFFWFANNYSNYGIFGILSLFLLSIGWNR